MPENADKQAVVEAKEAAVATNIEVVKARAPCTAEAREVVVSNASAGVWTGKSEAKMAVRAHSLDARAHTTSATATPLDRKAWMVNLQLSMQTGHRSEVN